MKTIPFRTLRFCDIFKAKHGGRWQLHVRLRAARSAVVISGPSAGDGVMCDSLNEPVVLVSRIPKPKGK
jgi:hypothetical protein